ncbi:MAG TPA: class I SAM-dependent methyltransferase, partial [Candidatus Glassbacteria bacterium]|nr:class I SAM-dependent methyltransferase [Candidatus Glassbacteria bacterium]
IGVFNGASMKIWRDYFVNSQIFGIDYVDKSEYDAERIKTIIADQANREQLTKVFQDLPEMDIIIDDGGHTMEQQQVSLGILFPYLKDGGIYVIEDLGTSRPRWARIYNKERTSKTTSWMINNFIETKKIDSEYITPEEARYVEKNTLSCKMGTVEIVFIKKV